MIHQKVVSFKRKAACDTVLEFHDTQSIFQVRSTYLVFFFQFSFNFIHWLKRDPLLDLEVVMGDQILLHDLKIISVTPQTSTSLFLQSLGTMTVEARRFELDMTLQLEVKFQHSLLLLIIVDLRKNKNLEFAHSRWQCSSKQGPQGSSLVH